jgi:hypothetical protein
MAILSEHYAARTILFGPFAVGLAGAALSLIYHFKYIIEDPD